MRTLIAIPVFNERGYVRGVLDKVLAQRAAIQQHSLDAHRNDPKGYDRVDVLVVDDGSTDGTPKIVGEFPVNMLRRTNNLGYGRSLREAFQWAVAQQYDWLITMDCDEQHEPAAIPEFLRMAREHPDADIISGSRYLATTHSVGKPPSDRRRINVLMTSELNARLAGRLGSRLTDAFCGFKAYRVSELAKLKLSVDGYAFPMQFWVQAAAERLRVIELPVRLIYNDPNRTFGGGLDQPERRLRHYRRVLHRELLRHRELLPTLALQGLANWAQRAQLVLEHAWNHETPCACEEDQSLERA
jgi:dolichol-phosphate mannosyltransferase